MTAGAVRRRNTDAVPLSATDSLPTRVWQAAHEATVGDKELKVGNIKVALKHYKNALGPLSPRR